MDTLTNFNNWIEKNLYYLFSVLNTRWGCGLEDLKIPLDRKTWYEPLRNLRWVQFRLKILSGTSPAWGGEPEGLH